VEFRDICLRKGPRAMLESFALHGIMDILLHKRFWISSKQMYITRAIIEKMHFTTLQCTTYVNPSLPAILSSIMSINKQ
jgi:hypothetical protein